ncbi:hypothetical protein [Haloferax gibbonsii]|nr:hypothetical protein [Haloferax gibbonsii]
MMQISFLFEYVPEWLSIALLAVGSTFVTWGLPFVDADDELSVETGQDVLGVILLGIGVGVTVWGTRSISVFAPIAVVVVLLTGFLEGLAAISIYKKLVDLVLRRSAPSGGSFRRKLFGGLLAFFLVVLSGWALVAAVVWGPIELGVGESVRLYWTVVTVTVTVIGMSTKFWSTKERSPTPILFGGVFLITGAEIVNLRFTTELTLYVGTVVAYTLGFWFGVALLIRGAQRISRERTTGRRSWD